MAWRLIPFLLVLFCFGIALGRLRGRDGPALRPPAAEWFVWPIPAILSPFAAVFYPIATLPPWMRCVSRLLPPSYVFRVHADDPGGGPVWWSGLLWSLSLAAADILPGRLALHPHLPPCGPHRPDCPLQRRDAVVALTAISVDLGIPLRYNALCRRRKENTVGRVRIVDLQSVAGSEAGFDGSSLGGSFARRQESGVPSWHKDILDDRRKAFGPGGSLHPTGTRPRRGSEGRTDSSCRIKGHVVGKYTKLLERILNGRSDANVRFSDLVQLLVHLKFDERIRGDHHIFTRPDIEEIFESTAQRSDGQGVSGQAGPKCDTQTQAKVDENE